MRISGGAAVAGMDGAGADGADGADSEAATLDLGRMDEWHGTSNEKKNKRCSKNSKPGSIVSVRGTRSAQA